ncbi:DUF3667 domain-containing protein [Kaistella carnis]|uniref:DUF3667 domain-containing protein n=1 Tax=Kaistella carnis TaxID=1241979 RepID=A0A3G8XNT4_9FLAO|nr:DUF3667 domain-containing protein [Kaistella carnis]AZI33447.1 DUF3667 domain-containing protein [Kaistella carnis]
MSHGKLREEKNCLNCGHFVAEKFCPNCGQENTETRKPFHYLFTHFVEDLTHYDGQFWGTIKNLLLKPGKLTETYLEGKRQRFVPPVKLYIFISFITFFLFALFPPFHLDFEAKADSKNKKEKTIFAQAAISQTQKIVDSLKAKENKTYEDSVQIEKLSAIVGDSATINNFQEQLNLDKGLEEDFPYKNFKTRKAYDSAQAKNPSSWNFLDKAFAYKLFELKEKGAKKGDILRNLIETSLHNLPKALFLYLPVFAFFLWIFHNKKKWWYFEHGVFTLHYFSFLLLNILCVTFLFKLVGLTESDFLNRLLYVIISGMIVYSMLYFFIAHRRVYHFHGFTSFIVGCILFLVNFFAFTMVVIGLGIVSFLMIH